MPIYEYGCPSDHMTTLIRTMAARNEPVACETCGEGAVLHFSMFALETNEASVWPRKNDALIPDDPKMERAYREKGWIVSDGMGGETVNCENKKHFDSMCQQQDLKMTEDYEKPSRSVTRKPKRQKRKPKEYPGAEKAEKKALDALYDKGIKIDPRELKRQRLQKRRRKDGGSTI